MNYKVFLAVVGLMSGVRAGGLIAGHGGLIGAPLATSVVGTRTITTHGGLASPLALSAPIVGTSGLVSPLSLGSGVIGTHGGLIGAPLATSVIGARTITTHGGLASPLALSAPLVGSSGLVSSIGIGGIGTHGALIGAHSPILRSAPIAVSHSNLVSSPWLGANSLSAASSIW